LGEKEWAKGILIEIGRWSDPRSGRVDQAHLGAKAAGTRERAGEVRAPVHG